MRAMTPRGFEPTTSYQLIYVFAAPDTHGDLLKIGRATIHTHKTADELPPNCSDLNHAAKKRINGYAGTSGMPYTLLHTELAVCDRITKDGTHVLGSFDDRAVHAVLERSGYPREHIPGTTAQEWYDVSLQVAVAAIRAVKEGRQNLGGVKVDDVRTPIIFRQEQQAAISAAIRRFKKNDRYLWNAKMRFGKTLCALEVVKRERFGKTIIMTHRPVVDDGWYGDFNKIFSPEDGYLYGSHANGYSLHDLLASGRKFVYFASIQDLRGSSQVGGKFDKNQEVFDTVWDCVIVDEAHEGTTTALGDKTLKQVFKEKLHRTKMLALSGTPFNIISEYSGEDVYTWDYVMEQEAKTTWDEHHGGDHNPYDDLPEMHIYTYDLGDLLHDGRYLSIEDKAFNFREFFRVNDSGQFMHQEDVTAFLDLLTSNSSHSAYPFATDEYRAMFKHTFWVVPGVKEALALQDLLERHPVFGSGMFDIVNVAGDGDEEDPADKALQLVKRRIAEAKKNGRYTITLSCGKLTTGVTVPEWTGCLMLAGSSSTSASSYLQTIFRVQSPYTDEQGRVKEHCYVFDFAPDRTLKMISQGVSISAKAGETSNDDRSALGKFLNYCPVIAIDGSTMREYDTAKLLQQLKRVYAERAVRNGFEDSCLYNDELLKLDDMDVEAFKELKGVVGENKAQKSLDTVTLNDQGLTGEEYEQEKQLSRKPKKELTEEERRFLDKLKKAKENRRNAIRILTQVSVRMPLLIYGADIPYDDDITLERFVELVDDESWAEFMPQGVTKRVFRKFVKYYDPEVFVAAGRNIRDRAQFADTLQPTERVQRIAALFATFRNPDKETVLTPWRVVNMHLSDCIGGWCFWDDRFQEPLPDGPRFVDRGQVTASVLEDTTAKVLEVNSKTGLYPLYATYSMFRQRCGDRFSDMGKDEQYRVWNAVVQENMFVICKTQMAKQITRRTLVGYSGIPINAHYFEHLDNALQNKTRQFITKISAPSFWRKKKGPTMKWTACIGNPPYQKTDGGHGPSASPVYQHFVQTAIALNPEYVSMITPSRWFTGGKGLDEFREQMLHDHHLRLLVDFPRLYEPFPNVKIRGGISYFLWDRDYDGPCTVETIEGGERSGEPTARYLDAYDVVIRQNEAVPILDKVTCRGEITLDKRVSARKPFGFPTNFHGASTPEGMNAPIQLFGSQRISWIERNGITTNADWVDDWKVLMTAVQGTSAAVETKFLSDPIVAGPGTACTETYVVAGRFNDEDEAEHFASYLRTRFARFLVSLRKATQHATRDVYAFVPDVPYDHPWTDAMLYERYHLTDEEIALIETTVKPME